MSNNIYALVDSDNTIIRSQAFDQKPSDPVGKGWKWLSVITQPDPDYNSNFEYFTVTEQVNAENVTEIKTVLFKETDVIRNFVVGEIKTHAQKLISEMFVTSSSYKIEEVLIKEINFIARASELINKKADGATITEEEQTEIDNFQATWDMIKTIRLLSDQKELEIANMSAEELKSYDVTANWI